MYTSVPEDIIREESQDEEGDTDEESVAGDKPHTNILYNSFQEECDSTNTKEKKLKEKPIDVKSDIRYNRGKIQRVQTVESDEESSDKDCDEFEIGVLEYFISKLSV